MKESLVDRPLSGRHVKLDDGCLTEPSVEHKISHTKVASMSEHEILKARFESHSSRREK